MFVGVTETATNNGNTREKLNTLENGYQPMGLHLGIPSKLSIGKRFTERKPKKKKTTATKSPLKPPVAVKTVADPSKEPVKAAASGDDDQMYGPLCLSDLVDSPDKSHRKEENGSGSESENEYYNEVPSSRKSAQADSLERLDMPQYDYAEPDLQSTQPEGSKVTSFQEQSLKYVNVPPKATKSPPKIATKKSTKKVSSHHP